MSQALQLGGIDEELADNATRSKSLTSARIARRIATDASFIGLD